MLSSALSTHTQLSLIQLPCLFLRNLFRGYPRIHHDIHSRCVVPQYMDPRQPLLSPWFTDNQGVRDDNIFCLHYDCDQKIVFDPPWIFRNWTNLEQEAFPNIECVFKTSSIIFLCCCLTPLLAPYIWVGWTNSETSRYVDHNPLPTNSSENSKPYDYF